LRSVLGRAKRSPARSVSEFSEVRPVLTLTLKEKGAFPT
jgi:hypothetical protein